MIHYFIMKKKCIHQYSFQSFVLNIRLFEGKMKTFDKKMKLEKPKKTFDSRLFEILDFLTSLQHI